MTIRKPAAIVTVIVGVLMFGVVILLCLQNHYLKKELRAVRDLVDNIDMTGRDRAFMRCVLVSDIVEWRKSYRNPELRKGTPTEMCPEVIVQPMDEGYGPYSINMSIRFSWKPSEDDLDDFRLKVPNVMPGTWTDPVPVDPVAIGEPNQTGRKYPRYYYKMTYRGPERPWREKRKGKAELSPAGGE